MLRTAICWEGSISEMGDVGHLSRMFVFAVSNAFDSFGKMGVRS